MKAIAILPLAAFASAIVVPDENVFAQIPLEEAQTQRFDLWDKLPSLNKITHRLSKPFKHVTERVPQSLDEAFARAHHGDDDDDDISERHSPFDFTSWIEDALQRWEIDGPHGPPHGPPGKGKKPGKRPGKKPGWRWPHHKPPHHHHSPPNQTIYELISKSNYTTNLTKLIDEDKDLVKLLNGTEANYTIFAPTDFAFSKLPKDHKPSKEIIKKVLLYHILPGFAPSWKLVFNHTSPTLLKPATLGGNPQRVLVRWLGFFRGLRINYYDRIIAANIVSQLHLSPM